VPAAGTNSADHPQSGAGYSPNYSGDKTRPENFFEFRAFDTASGTAIPTDTQSLVLRRGRLFRIHRSERLGSMCLSRARDRGSEANQPNLPIIVQHHDATCLPQGNLDERFNERFLAASRWPVQLSFTMILRVGPEQCMVFHAS
jgi:hypothetical protein